MIDSIENGLSLVQSWLFERAVEPLMYSLGLMAWLERAYEGLEWVVLGALQVLLLYAILRPLEALWPAEPLTDRRAARVDVIYTLLHRLGVFPLLFFVVLTPFAFGASRLMRELDLTPFQLDDLWPGVTDIAWVSFLLYLVVLDFVDYWIHRAQHRFAWWWALHALHHSQRQMTFWADNRNHVLDDLIRDAILAAAALAIGAEPGQFVGIVLLTRAVQSLHHANIRLSFGPFDAALVSPVFHRRHHAIGSGHEGAHLGCNFAVLFPVWDVLFGTANFDRRIEPTGIRDQLPQPLGRQRDYGQGFWSQQWLGLKRLINHSA
ncbi:MAG: sterol desaturase family protein [Burkholderiaceae bacterium]